MPKLTVIEQSETNDGDAKRENAPRQGSRFRKGVSGNPAGRPKGSKNLATIFKEAADQAVVVKIAGKNRKISTARATILQLAEKARNGDHRAMAKFLNYMDEFEKRAAAVRPIQYPFCAEDAEVIQAVYDRLKLSRQKRGLD